MGRTHPDIEIIKFGVLVNEGEETFVDTQLESIHFVIPENSKYVITAYFYVKNRPLENLRYKYVVKKHGIPMKNRELEMGNYEPSDELYSKTFPEDTTPGGFLVRGTFPAVSTYYAGDEELMTVEWSLEVTKKT